MAERTFENTKGEIWRWEETPETIEALKQLHETIRKNKLNYNETTNT